MLRDKAFGIYHFCVNMVAEFFSKGSFYNFKYGILYNYIQAGIACYQGSITNKLVVYIPLILISSFFRLATAAIYSLESLAGF